MGVPSAAIVYTGAAGEMPGSGRGAAYFEGVNIDNTVIDKALEDLRTYEKERAKEEQDKRKAWDDLMLEDVDSWNVDMPKIEEKANEYTNYIHSLMQDPKKDPQNLPIEDRKKINQMAAEIKKMTNAAKTNQEIWKRDSLEISKNPDKYDQLHATDWSKNFMNPDLTPQQRLEYAQQNNIFRKNVNLLDVVGSIDDAMSEGEYKKDGQAWIGKDPEGFKKVFNTMLNNANFSQDYDSLLSQYGDKDKLEAAAVDMFKQMNPGKKRPPKQTGSGGGDGGGDKKTKKKVEIISTGKVAGKDWDQNYSINVLSVGNDAPAIFANSNPVYNENGELIQESIPVSNFKPVGGFYLKKGGAVTAIGTGETDDGKQVKVEVDYDTNKYNFESNGYPNMFDIFRQKTGAGYGTTKAKTETDEEAAKRIFEELSK